MKQVFLAIIIALMAIGLYGQGREKAQEEPLPVQTEEVRLKVVYEKTFDEEILDVIFDTATVTIEEAKQMGWKEEAFSEEEKAKGKTLVSYPKVVLTSRGRELSWLPDERRSSYDANELVFYNEKSEVLSRLELSWEEGAEHVYISPKMRYIVVSRRPTEWKPDYSGGTLYDLNGNKIWEIEGPTPIAVSDEGFAVASYLDWQVPPEPGGDFYVYNSKGKLIAIIENPLKEKTAPLFAEFSKDGEYVILCFSDETYSSAIFLLITKKGESLWQKEFPKHYYSRWVGEIEILVGKGIAGFVENGGVWTFYFDWRGDLKWFIQLKTLGYACCKFTQNAEKIYISSSTGYLWCFNKNDGGIIWKEKISDKGKAFTELYEEKQCIVLKDDEYSKCFLFDGKTGKVRAEIEYPGKKIFLVQHNGIIFVINTTDNKVEGIKIEEE